MEAYDYDNWKLDNNEPGKYYCDSCEEEALEEDLYEHRHNLYCCGCLERIQGSGSGNDLNDLIYAKYED